MKLFRLMPLYMLQGIIRIGGPRSGDAYLEICDRIVYEAAAYAKKNDAILLSWLGGVQ